MRKILSLLVILCLSIFPACAATTTSQQTSLNRVTTIGTALLSKNSLPTKVTFTILETEEVNAYASDEKEICVYTGLLKYVANDSELAGVIAHEIGHIVNSHVAKQNIVNTITTNAISLSNMNEYAKLGALAANNLTMKKVSRVEEYEADITGTDLMIKAGYNPLAMVSFLYKIGGNYKDFASDHPSGDKRTMYIYDYLTYTYPDKVKGTYDSDAYRQFMQYAKPIIEARNKDPKKLAKFNKEQEKFKQKRLKKLEKYKTGSAVSGWDKSYEYLKLINEQG